MAVDRLWTVTVLASSGTKTLRIKAAGKAEARSRASLYGSVIDVKRDFGGGLWKAGMNVAERATFMNRLAQLSLAKVPLSEGLRSMRDTLHGRTGVAAGLILDAMSTGMSLDQAMEANPKDFPPSVTSLVRAGLKTGSTSKALKDSVEFERMFAGAKKGSDLTLSISSMQILVAAVIAVSAGPLTDMMLGDVMHVMTGNEIDSQWALAFQVSDYISTAVTAMAAVMISAMVFFAFLSGVGKRIFPIFADSVTLHIPYYRVLVLSLQNYISLYQLSLLIRAGVQLEKSLSLAAEATPRGAMRADLSEAAADVRKGRSWAGRLRMISPTDRLALTFASDRQTMADTLFGIAGFYKDEYANKLATIAPTLKYVAFFMFVAVAVVVGVETMVPTLVIMEGIKM